AKRACSSICRGRSKPGLTKCLVWNGPYKWTSLLKNRVIRAWYHRLRLANDMYTARGSSGTENAIGAGFECTLGDCQTADNGKHRLIEGATGRRGRNGENREGVAVGERGRDVVTDHAPQAGVGEPGEGHRCACQRIFGCPGCPAIRGRDKAYLQLTSARAEIEGQAKVGGTAREDFVDRQAGDHMIDTTTYRVDGDARYTRPACPVGGGAHHHVVGCTAGFEAAVLPDDVDFARAIDLCGRKRFRTQAGDAVIVEGGDDYGTIPAGPSIGRGERTNGIARSTLIGHNHGPTGLNEGLTAEAMITERGSFRRAPS